MLPSGKVDVNIYVPSYELWSHEIHTKSSACSNHLRKTWDAHCEFTLLIVPRRENFLCINLIYKSGNPLSKKLGSKNCQQLGQEVLGDPSLMELHCQEDSLMSIRLQPGGHVECGTSTTQKEKQQKY